MKNLKSLSLIALFLFCMTACEQADTIPPTIVVASPEEDATIEAGEKLCVKVTFTDNKALSAYKINIHPNFNGHSHAPMRSLASSTLATEQTVDFEVTLTSASQNDPLTGTNCFRDIDIDIPDNATPGNYHLLIYCTDAAGNEMYVAQDLKIVQP